MKNSAARPSSEPSGPPGAARARARRHLLAWVPVIVWVLVILGFSTDIGSSHRTSRIIGPLLRWIHPGISDQMVKDVQTVIRKGAHLAEYAVLSLLIWRGLRRSRREPPLAWNRREAIAAVALAALVAGLDEWHQSTIPTRQGQFSDVLIDSAGATAGMAALWWAGRRRKRW